MDGMYCNPDPEDDMTLGYNGTDVLMVSQPVQCTASTSRTAGAQTPRTA